jgi:hypothetical protein
LGEECYARTWADGQSFTLEAAVRQALAEANVRVTSSGPEAFAAPD